MFEAYLVGFLKAIDRFGETACSLSRQKLHENMTIRLSFATVGPRCRPTSPM